MATAEALMTVEEYAEMPDDGRRTELVRGRIIELTRPTFLHGYVCLEIASILRNWVKERGLGRVVGNDSGIVTERNPDTLRGADVAYYSYARLPKDRVPEKYPNVAPDIVIEVRSPSDRWRDIHAKVAEYLNMGVLVVCVLDPEPQSAHLYYPDQPNRTLGPNDELTFPECLPDFRVSIRSLFE
jgi:Uma2 family endonuclease